MDKPIVSVELNSFDQRVAVNGINYYRNYLIENGYPTEDVDSLLLKIINAPARSIRRISDREAR